MPRIDSYPGIRRVALLMARDAGAVSPTCTEAEWLASTDPVLGAEGVDEEELRELDAWCAALTDEQATTFATGEWGEAAEAAERLGLPVPYVVFLFEDIADQCL